MYKKIQFDKEFSVSFEKKCNSGTPSCEQKRPWIAPDWDEQDVAALTAGISFSFTNDGAGCSGS